MKFRPLLLILAFACATRPAVAEPSGLPASSATSGEASEATPEAASVHGTASAASASARMARITSDTTYYDRKEGMAVFTGHVFVDDEQYQLHAEKAYVFMTGTNALKRIVAIGNVALTNGLRHASGAKASYYRESGMVVLYGGDGRNAEIVDASKGNGQDQTLRGSKIKFWIDSEQVEVLDASIVAPASSKPNGLGEALKLR